MLAAGTTSSCGSEDGRASDAATFVPQTTSPAAPVSTDGGTDTTPAPTETVETTPSPTLLAPPKDEDLVRVGQLFVRFAQGDSRLAVPPIDTPVLLMVGGQPVKTVSSRDAIERSSWEGLCPEAGSYAGRTCPFSFLEPFKDARQPVTFSMEPAQHPCAHPTAVTPTDVGGSLLVTLVPNPRADCLAYVAVELYVNDVLQIVAANLVWSEP